MTIVDVMTLDKQKWVRLDDYNAESLRADRCDHAMRVLDQDLNIKIRELMEVVRAALDRVHHDEDCRKVIARSVERACTCGAKEWREMAREALEGK